MPDASRHDAITAKTRWQSGRLAAIALIGFTGSAAIAITNPTDAKSVRMVVDAAAARYVRENPQAAAIAIGVVYGDASYQSRSGTLEPGKRRPPRHDTRYPVASITKTFTGTLLAQAVIEKRLSLSDDIRKHLDGDFPNLEFAGRPILMADLLDHRSGLPFFLPDKPEPTRFPGRSATARGARERGVEDVRPRSILCGPSHTHAHGCAGQPLPILQRRSATGRVILEKLYGLSYEQLLRNKILVPLQMNSTTITLSLAARNRLAPGWDDKRRLAILPEGAEAAGGMKSTTGDMLKYVRWQVDETDPAVKLSHQRVWTADDLVYGGHGTFGIGLNWQVAELSGRRVIFQDGMIEGYSALVVIEPESKLGIVLMTNQLDQKSAAAERALMKELLTRLDSRAVPLPE